MHEDEVPQYPPPAYPGKIKNPGRIKKAYDSFKHTLQTNRFTPGRIKKAYDSFKHTLQTNRFTSHFFPPKGEVASNITLMLAVVIIFFCARAILGKYSALGGTIFAIFILVFFALVAGQIVLQLAALLSKLAGFEIRVPQLLGMMAVGIFCKNVPYNSYEFNSPECLNRSLTQGTHHEAFNGNLSALTAHDDLNAHGVVMNVYDALKDEHERIVEHLKNTTANPKGIDGEGIKSMPESDDHHHRARRSGGHDEPAEYHDPCVKRFIGGDVDPTVKVILRSTCLTCILLMAGLELDPPQLWRLKWIVLRTTFIPCIVEAFAAALFCYLILGFPFLPGLCFGFVLCGVSPAVIIPSLVNLGQRGYGVKKGIPTLVIATCSADDLVALGGFGIAAGITFNPDASITDLASHGPLEVLVGIVFGIFWGYICQWFPSKQNANHVFFRWVLLTAGGLMELEVWLV